MGALGLTKEEAIRQYGSKILGYYDSARTATLMGEQYLCDVYMTTDGWYFLMLDK